MDYLLEVTVLFALALALSFLVERALEVLSALYRLIDSRFDFYHFWNKRAVKLRNRLEKKLRIYEYLEPKKMALILNRFNEFLLNSQNGYSGHVPIIAGDMIRALWVKVSLKVLGIILGILLALNLEVDLISFWIEAAGPEVKWIPQISPTLALIFTGVAIGFGSGPVHKIITRIEKRKK